MFKVGLRLVVFISLALLPKVTRAMVERSILDELTVKDRIDVAHDADLLVLKSEHRVEGRLTTETGFSVPLTITLVAKTNAQNLRLRYGKQGLLIFNWELNENELRFHDPKTGKQNAIRNKGSIPKDTFVTVRWSVDENTSRVEVDGEERAVIHGDYAGLSGPIGVSTFGSTVTIRSLTVSGSRSGGGETASKNGKIEVNVPCAKPASSQPTTATDPDYAKIERPEFSSTPKRIVKSLSTVTALVVRTSDDGQMIGKATDIIATVPGQSRLGDKAGTGFYRADGDEMMRTAFEEAVRAVNIRYPMWEPGHIDFSFGEKFVAHGGPSAGTAFAALMLSCLEGFDIDTKCAVTGDVTVDWRVRKVGGVTAKVRGATLDKCLYIAIPDDNAAAFEDMALLYGNSSLWDIQAFTISNLQQAVSILRVDRPERFAKAISLFADLQEKLKKSERSTLRSPETRDTLYRILKLAPNHLSAKCILALADGTAPKTLSLNATAYQLGIIFYPYTRIFNSGQPLDRQSLPHRVTVQAKQRFNTLAPLAHKDLRPIIGDVSSYIDTMDELADRSISNTTAEKRLDEILGRMDKIMGDPKYTEKLIREGY